MFTLLQPPLQPFLDDLEKLAKLFDLKDDGLGTRILDAAADGILEMCDDQRDIEGLPWADLSDWTKREKREAVGFVYPIGVFTDRMLQPDQIKGERDVSHQTASMTYGLDFRNKVVATRFQEGENALGYPQPERRFYGFNSIAVAKMAQVTDDRFLSFSL